MLRLSIDEVQPGMRVAAPLFNQQGGLLLRTGTELTDVYITSLRRRGVSVLWIDTPETSDIVALDLLSEATRVAASGRMAALFDESHGVLSALGSANPELVRGYLRSPEFLRSTAALPYWDMAEVVNSIIDDALSGDPVTALLTTLKTTDTYQFSHAVDSTVVAVILGQQFRLERGDLRRLARGCLLHDLGMALIDEAVSGKAGELAGDERAQIEQHPSLGYELLSRVQKDDVLVNHIAFQHHERQDGRGYPRRLTGDNTISRDRLSLGAGRITPLAEIVAVADIYDALFADRPFRAAHAHDVVLLMLEQMAGTVLNAAAVKALLDLVPPYPIATEVVVTEGPIRGYFGVVCQIDRKCLDRPVVRLLENARGEKIRPFEVDLRRTPTVAIRALPPVRPKQPTLEG